MAIPSLKERFKRLTRHRELTILLSSLVCSFTVCFFSPVDLFLGNQREFTVGPQHIILPLLLVALLSAAGAFLLFNLFLLISRRFWRGMECLVFGALLAMYLQMLLMNGRMREFTGDGVSYDDPVFLTANMLIEYAIVLIPTIVYLLSEFKPEQPVLKAIRSHAIIYISGALLIMQAVGTGSIVAQHGIRKVDSTQYVRYLSYEPVTKLSSENNVVVFLTDRLDSLWMDETLGWYPSLYKTLDGFTFYQNNIANFTNTFPSVPNMLTTAPFRNETAQKYLTQAWAGNTLTRRLHDNGVLVNLLVDGATTYTKFYDLDGQCDNLIYDPTIPYEVNYVGYSGIIPTMLRFSLDKLTPYCIKEQLALRVTSDFSNSFITISGDLPDAQPWGVGTESDLRFNDFLRTHKVTAGSDKPTFSFIHLNFAHDTSLELQSLCPETRDLTYGNSNATVRGAFTILEQYFDQMKEAGVWDCSTVIILGDHGHVPVELECDHQERLDSPIVTALLIKPRNAPAEPMQRDLHTELANNYFASSVLEYAGVDRTGFGPSFDDIINGMTPPPRYMQTSQTTGGNGYGDASLFYEVTGNARDLANWKIVAGFPAAGSAGQQ
ncbi:MAG: hypothetical protein IK107_04610 [Oscillospiraceae bacterium]|nr:hypothetical protein [Oscillospiraceae bacterium]